MKTIKYIGYIITTFIAAFYYRVKELFTGVDETMPETMQISPECEYDNCDDCFYGFMLRCECDCHDIK